MMKKLLWNGFIKKNCHLNFQTLSALNSLQGLFVFSCPAVVPQLFIAFLQLSIERKNYFLILSSLADIKQITIPIHLQAAHVRNAHRQHVHVLSIIRQGTHYWSHVDELRFYYLYSYRPSTMHLAVLLDFSYFGSEIWSHGHFHWKRSS